MHSKNASFSFGLDFLCFLFRSKIDIFIHKIIFWNRLEVCLIFVDSWILIERKIGSGTGWKKSFSVHFSSRITEKDAFLLDSNREQIKVNMLAIPEKPLIFQISKKWRHRQTIHQKKTHFKKLSLFLRLFFFNFENKKKRRYLCIKNKIIQDLINKHEQEKKKRHEIFNSLLNFNVNPEFISFFHFLFIFGFFFQLS